MASPRTTTDVESVELKKPPLCPLCGEEPVPHLRVRDTATLDPFIVLRCKRCALGITDPQPQDLGRYYRDYHGDRHAFTARYCAARRLTLLRRVAGARTGRLLDIGCGDGTFLLGARSNGWEVMGTELSADRPRGQGLHVVSEIEELPPGSTFDCITLWHSLEHLRDPLAMVQRIHALLASDGLLMIAVPDYGGLQARFFAANWLHLDVPRHLFHFTQRSLSTLLAKAGFAPVRWWHQEFEYDLMGWSQSMLNVLMPKPNIFFDMVPGRPTNSNSLERSLNWIGGVGLCTLGVPLVLLSRLAGRGGTLIVAAKPVPAQS